MLFPCFLLIFNLSATAGTSEYGDQSGMMGFSYGYDDFPKMCFNSAKSWQLGWYSDKTAVFDPMAIPSWTGDLVGIANYDIAASNPVILKIESTTKIDYYISFNRQSGMNIETQEAGNQVLVTSQGENVLPSADPYLWRKFQKTTRL